LSAQPFCYCSIAIVLIGFFDPEETVFVVSGGTLLRDAAKNASKRKFAATLVYFEYRKKVFFFC